MSFSPFTSLEEVEKTKENYSKMAASPIFFCEKVKLMQEDGAEKVVCFLSIWNLFSINWGKIEQHWYSATSKKIIIVFLMTVSHFKHC